MMAIVLLQFLIHRRGKMKKNIKKRNTEVRLAKAIIFVVIMGILIGGADLIVQDKNYQKNKTKIYFFGK